VARGGGRQQAAVGIAAARRAVTLRAVGTDSGAVGTTPRRARAEENGRWAGCPGGFGPVL
jgi:hypothetical protein